jgi:PAS domain S-box-containing protein
MGASRARPPAERAADLTTSSGLPSSSPTAVLEFAVEKLLRGAAPDAMSAVLRRLVEVFGGRAALAVQYQADRTMVVLAAYPDQAARDPALLAIIQGEDPPPHVLLVSSPAGDQPSSPGSDQPLCTLALVSDDPAWTAETRSTMRVIAAIVAARIRQTNANAGLAERRAVNIALVNQTPNAVVTANPRWRIVEFNRSAEQLFGHRREDVLGRPLTDLLPSRERSRFLQSVQSYRRPQDMRDAAHRIRVPVLLADGTESRVEMTRVPLTVEGETYFCGIVRDLTELERAQAAVEESERRFRMLARLAPVGIVQTDPSGQCTYVNERWCALTGMTEQDALTANWAQFLHPDDVSRLEREWVRAAEHGAELRIDCRLRTVRGGEVWVHVAAMAVPGPDDQPAGYLAALTNISDRKRAELEQERLLAAEQRMHDAELAARQAAELAQQRLAEQNTRLQQLDEAKTQFLGTVSHELRTPLTSIVSFTELIRETGNELSPDTTSALDVIERNAQRLLRLVGDLLLLSRIEEGIIPFDLSQLSIPELVREAASSASASAAQRDIGIEVSAQDGPTVLADGNRLEQVLDNLLSNAVKFTDPGGRVRMAATHDGTTWRIDVADSGIGIPPDELSQVFDRFARASNARKASVPGSGLGLSVVKGITELHGGRVEAESTVGAGTTFHVYLPISR